MSFGKAVKKIKTLVVVAKKTILKVGDTIIPAPIGVKIDPKTGELMVPIKVIPVGDAVLKPEIEKDLLINQGFIKLLLIFKEDDCEPCTDVRKKITKEVLVPIQSVHKIDCLYSGDHIQEKVKVKAITVRGIPVNDCKSGGTKWDLIIKVILQVKIVIAREEIISVPVLNKHEAGCKVTDCMEDFSEREEKAEYQNLMELLVETVE